MPLPGDFLSGVHRGRFNPKDGQLYVSGMAGWGTYTPDDGCFQRVRYTGEPRAATDRLSRPRKRRAADLFAGRLTERVAEQAKRHFAQAWNYRYSASYGSPELSPRHPGQPGHDALTIRSAHVLADGHSLFLEIPELQPVNQLHLHVATGVGRTDRLVRDDASTGRSRSPGFRATLRRPRRSPPTRSWPTWWL